MCNMASLGSNGTSILMANTSYNGSVEAADCDDTGAGLSSYDMSVHFNPTMAIIIVVLLAAFVFLGFFSVYIKKWANPTPPPPRMIPRPQCSSSQGIDKAVIEALPIIQYTTEVVKEPSMLASCCPVCLTEFEENESLRLLPQCGHCFHHACIDMWLLSHTTCPVCRSVLKISNHASPASEQNPFVQSTDSHQGHICIDIGTERQQVSDARLFNHTGNSIKENGESSQMNKSSREHLHPASSSEDVGKRNLSCSIPPDTTSENNSEATATNASDLEESSFFREQSFWVIRLLARFKL